MSKSKLQTSMLGRQIRVGITLDKRLSLLGAVLEGGRQSQPVQTLCRSVHDNVAEKTGEIVTVYQQDGSILYSTLIDGKIVDLDADEFDVIAELKDVKPSRTHHRSHRPHRSQCGLRGYE